nr:TatD family hydrolase [Labilibaculum sp.]
MSIPLVPYIDIHTHSSVVQSDICSIQSKSMEEQIKDNGKAIYSLGIHPWKIEDINIASTLEKLEQISSQNHILAIGEIGLDRLIQTPLSVQIEILLSQISIAERAQKPIVIHCVKSFPELIEIRKKHKSFPWIIHGFQKNKIIADELIELGCYLSFGKALFTNKKLRALFCSLPTSQIFLETDESDVSIKEIYNKVADIKEMELESLKKELFKNFKTCFKK